MVNYHIVEWCDIASSSVFGIHFLSLCLSNNLPQKHIARLLLKFYLCKSLKDGLEIIVNGTDICWHVSSGSFSNFTFPSCKIIHSQFFVGLKMPCLWEMGRHTRKHPPLNPTPSMGGAHPAC